MRWMWRKFKAFMTDEEIPRWLGFSLVLVYLVGLGTVANLGITHARQDAAAQYHLNGRYAAGMLAANLSSRLVGAGGAADTDAVQNLLAGFSAGFSPRSARILDHNRRVIASLDPSEQGAVVDEPLRSGGSDTLDGRHSAASLFVRLPLHSAADRGESAEPLFLEVVLPPEPEQVNGVTDTAQVLAAILVVLGALFVVYRCLREQLRGVSRIARKLCTHGGRLEDELGALRIADTLDSVTASWNELVEIAERLSLECKRSEADAELSKALQQVAGGTLAEALNAHPDGLIYLADETRIGFVNSTARHLFGWRTEDVRDTPLDGLKADGVGGQMLALIREAVLPDGSIEGRAERVTVSDSADAGQSCYSVRIIPTPGVQRMGHALVVIRDVSQQVRADLAREEFITQVTHELRTPLTNIRAYAETLSSGVFDDPAVITDCYNVITKETRRLSRLIEDVLSVSQLEVGSIELQFDAVDLRGLLSDGVRDVRNLADEKDIDIQLVLPAKLEAVRIDRDKMAVVINNLLGNAIKYTPEGGNVVVGCKMTSGEVIITVKDDGIGIAAGDQARVFEKFQRADDPQVQSETGTGIGLFTAREIARRHHGDIELISDKGQGSTFVVRLPHAESRATTLTTAKEA